MRERETRARDDKLGSTRGTRGTGAGTRDARADARRGVFVRARVCNFSFHGVLTLGFRVSFARAVITEVTPK